MLIILSFRGIYVHKKRPIKPKQEDFNMKKFKAHTNEELIPHIEDGNEEALELLSLPVWENAIKECDRACVIGHVAAGHIGEF